MADARKPSKEEPKKDKQPKLGFCKKVTSSLLEDKDLTATITKTEKRAILVSSALIVLRIDEKSNMANVIEIGDYITQVNGVRITSKEHFYKEIKGVLAKGSPETITFHIRRPKWMIKTTSHGFEQVAEGYDYYTSLMVLLPGHVIGMNIRAYQNRVYVSSVQPRSLAARSIRIGDCIAGVDQTPCLSVKDCLNMMDFIMKKDKAVTLHLERPVSPEAVEVVKAALRARKNNMADHLLAPDACEIGRQQAEKIRAGNLPKPKLIMKKPNKKPAAGDSVKRHVKVEETASQIKIDSDPFNPIFLASLPQNRGEPSQPAKSGRSGDVGGIGNFDKQ
ncbi:unnamed protein product [Bursaphelenchus okinawaensis]|uniref:PDZ domain-containing protein n=1 Tax=Bursaphelenchus okinawaensis TaxID=465554 RepID=A0A811LLM4_9BILA|nr:unnamed protein product [Bursaphelenchus okinawaensis]CAG9124700.1 unnamed protein product [Bursaphelenchus okinawaensis]